MNIKRQMTEKDVLKLFGIPSFRHMTKEMVTSFYLASIAFGFVVAALVSTLGNRSHVALPRPN